MNKWNLILYHSKWQKMRLKKAMKLLATLSDTDYLTLSQLRGESPHSEVNLAVEEKMAFGDKVSHVFREQDSKHRAKYRRALLENKQTLGETIINRPYNDHGRGKFAFFFLPERMGTESALFAGLYPSIHDFPSTEEVWELSTPADNNLIFFSEELTASFPETISADAPDNAQYIVFIQYATVETGKYTDGAHAFSVVARLTLYEKTNVPSSLLLLKSIDVSGGRLHTKYGYGDGRGPDPSINYIVDELFKLLKIYIPVW